MLLERDAPLAVLASLLVQARGGRGTTVLISGEAGIGKTALCDAFVDMLDARSTRLLWGACEALATPRPLGPLIDIAEQMGGDLRDALRAGRPPYELFQCLLNEVRDDHRPCVVVIEDAHWADDASADLVKFIARRIARLPILLLITFREEEAAPSHPLIQALSDVPPDHLHRLRLPALTVEAVAALDRKGRRAEEIAKIHRICDGNPFLVTELLRQNGDDLSRTLRDSILSRLHRLSPAARACAEWIAVLPDRADWSLFGQALGPDAVVAVDECIDQGLLRSDRRHLRYRHELARRVVEHSLGESRCRSLNAQVLRLLEVQPAQAKALPRLVHHARAAHDADAVVRHAPAAGDEAARCGAHRQAAEFYRLALSHADRMRAAEIATLLDKLAWERMSSGALAEALVANQQAFDAWRAAGDGFAQGRNRRQRFHLSDLMTVAQRGAETIALDEAIALLTPHGPSSDLAIAYSEKLYAVSLAGDHAASEHYRSLALTMADDLADPAVTINVRLNCERQRHSFFGAPDVRTIRQTLGLAKGHGNDALTAQCFYYLCSCQCFTCEHEGLEQVLEEALGFAASRDLEAHFAMFESLAARFAVASGRWREAADTATRLLGQDRLPGLAEYSARIAIATLASRQGLPGALPAVESAVDAWKARIATRALELTCLCLTTESRWLAGDRTGALESATAARDLLRTIRDQARQLGIRPPTLREPWAAASWLWRELPAPVIGEFDGVIGLQVDGRWREAAAFWAQKQMPYERALALIHGDDPGAQREGFALLARLGATATIERCRADLAARGAPIVPRGPRPSTSNNAFGLTRREMNVLALIDEGLGNRAISQRLSRSAKTVEHHVAAILGKLGVATRAAAVLRARASGVLPVRGPHADDARR